ncbi:MAG: hypothetical protein K5656_00130 [Lachnospiraceae bacterium]|nr:hypothetical protein [Lachnospiraceae bacterium]
MIKFKRLIALVLAFTLVVSYGPVFMDTDAANGLKLKNTNVTLKVIKKDGVNYSSNHTIKIQKSKGIKILKTTYTSMNKSIAKVSKKGVVTPISAGNTVIIIKVKYKKKGKKISKKFKLDIEVILEDLDNSGIKPNYSTTTEVTATSAETKSTTEVTTTRSEAESTTAVELIATTSISIVHIYI